jgi:membrane-bound inhibitor of C-type lysozyme
MKKSGLFSILMFSAISMYAILPLSMPGVKWDEAYTFDKSNGFKMEIYAKNNELMRTVQYKTYYQSAGENFDVKLVTDRRGSGSETVIDKKNEVAIQVIGSGGGATPYYNAGGYKYPAEKDLKKLELVPANETKEILGYSCRKYTYTYKKIFGEVWITEQVSLPNDVGVFRACKMAALHNTVSVPGFVMEMTTEDSGGGRTLMTTVSLQEAGNYTIDFRGVEMNSAINKVNYYIF